MKDIVKSQSGGEYKVINGKRVKLSRRRRRSNLMTYCAIAVAIVTSIGLVAALCFLFDLKQVEVAGLTLYSNDQILAVGGVESGANLIRTNTSVIEKRLEENLPYVKTAQVDKSYPNSLIITITEEKKAADIELSGKYYVLSETGKILEAGNDLPDAGLPVVIGFGLKSKEPGSKLESDDSHKTKVLLQLLEAIRNCEFNGLSEIDITERTDIKMTYDDRIDIKFGSAMDMTYKLDSLKAVIENKLSYSYEGTLRYISANSGIQALPKGAETAATTKKTTTAVSPTDTETEYQETDAPSAGEEPAAEEQYTEPAAEEQYNEPEQPETPAEDYTGWQMDN